MSVGAVLFKGMVCEPASLDSINPIPKKIWGDEIMCRNDYEFKGDVLRIFIEGDEVELKYKAHVLEPSDQDAKIVYVALENLSPRCKSNEIRSFYLDLDISKYNKDGVIFNVLSIYKETISNVHYRVRGVLMCDTSIETGYLFKTK